ncbi:MAG TPA: CopG family transcriptional regulator [Desulfobulbaceae bacterium]|nr:CopG family transcriptional regulator [Desulfobulbaceae bacterium]
MPSPNRKAVRTYLMEEEQARIVAMARQTGLSVSTFIKRVCLGQEVRSKADQKAVLAVLKANADLGRLGGLLKKSLADGSAGMMAFELRQVLRQIEKNQAEVAGACQAVVASLRGSKP